jgi:hypothetical protein
MKSSTQRITLALALAAGCGVTFGIAAYLFAARGNGVLATLFLLLTFCTGIVYFGYFVYVVLTSKK